MTNQFQSQGVIFNGGTISDDYPGQGTWHCYKPPDGWSGVMEVDFTQPVENLTFTTGWVNTYPPNQFATVAVYSAVPSVAVGNTVAVEGDQEPSP